MVYINIIFNIKYKNMKFENENMIVMYWRRGEDEVIHNYIRKFMKREISRIVFVLCVGNSVVVVVPNIDCCSSQVT